MTIDRVTLTDLIRANIDAWERERLWTSILGIVDSFDPVKKSVNVQPAIRERNPNDPNGPGELLPLIINVPYEFVRAGGGPGYTQEWPVAPGDVVVLTVLRQSYDQWLLKGGAGVREPLNVRYDISQSIARPGPRTFTNEDPPVSTTDFVIRAVDGSVSISLKPSGVIEHDGAEIKIGANATKEAANGVDNDLNWAALQQWFITNAVALAAAGLTLGPVWPPPNPGLPPAGQPNVTAVTKTKVE